MKKLIALVLVALMLIPAVVYAWDTGAVLPKSACGSNEYSDVWVVMEQSTHCLFGMLYKNEKVDTFPAQSGTNCKVRGMTIEGVNRVAGKMKYLAADESVAGLTLTRAKSVILPEFQAIVEDIVHRQMGEDAEANTANILACTIYRTCETITHMMIGRSADKVAAVTVWFWGADCETIIYITDWDGDGQLDLVFAVNPGPEHKATPAPSPTPTPKPGKKTPKTTPAPTATPKPECKKICKPIININIGIIRQIINIGKGCWKNIPDCAKE